MQKWIEPSHQLVNDGPIEINISDVNKPAYGDPFLVTGHLQHRALVERVNQDFARVRNVDTPFTIEFPAQYSLIKGGDVIVFGEEAPTVFSLTNISVLGYAIFILKTLFNQYFSIGRDSNTPRVLGISFHVKPEVKGGVNMAPLAPGDIRLRTIDGTVYDDWGTGLQSKIMNIDPKESQYFATTVQFTNPDLKPYTRIQIEAHLHLGHVRDMDKPRCISVEISMQVDPLINHRYSNSTI